MFGGANDNAAAPADNQNEPVHGGTLDGASHNTVPADAPATEYNTSAYGGAGDPGTIPTDAPTSAPADQPVASDASSDLLTSNAPDDLLAIKQQALQQLSPLVGHLDQSPEEKFRTTMMMIQASDNPELIKDAYEAAQQIPDEKVRAQALLDVVNEINYFTQHQEQQQ